MPHTSDYKFVLLPAATASHVLHILLFFPHLWCTHVDFEVISSFPPRWKQHLFIPAAASKVAYSSRPSYRLRAGPLQQPSPPVKEAAVGRGVLLAESECDRAKNMKLQPWFCWESWPQLVHLKGFLMVVSCVLM